MPNRADLRLTRGDDYSSTVAVMQDDGQTPANLTGYTAQSQINPSYTNATAAAVFSITIAANNINLGLTHTQTAALAGDLYVWDLEVTDSTGLVTTLLTGQVVVRPEVA